jgi:hypothetical protein
VIVEIPAAAGSMEQNYSANHRTKFMLSGIFMKIHFNHFPATQILRVDVLTEGRANVPFLNWRVVPKAMAKRDSPRDEFAGAGIYGVCFDDQLIYIGSFLGSGGVKVNGVKAATSAGDIVAGRWWQHFGSITGRSHKLNVAASTYEKLSAEFGSDHLMVAAFRAAPQDMISKDAGCLGASERLRFAAKHLAEFIGGQVEPAHLLARFCYVYARLDGLPVGIAAHELSRRIKIAEATLIETLHPEVNTAGRIINQMPVSLDCIQVREKVLEALRDALACHLVDTDQANELASIPAHING